MNYLGLVDLEYVLRIVISGLCGICIGIERRNRAKEAGIRTHCVVACGAALMMIVSKYGFFDVISSGLFNGADVRLDPSRVASTIASGIGFLGAGMIFVHKNTITGLTTAAGIWATSGVGMAIGSGMYLVGITATFIILTAQILLHLEMPWTIRTKQRVLSVYGIEEGNFQELLQIRLEEYDVKIHSVSIKKNIETGTKDFVFSIEMPATSDDEAVLECIEYNCKISAVQ